MTTPLPYALAQLDPKNDAHWTTEGLPAMAVVNEFANGGEYNRKDLPEGLTRETHEDFFKDNPVLAPNPAANKEDFKATDEDKEDQSILAEAAKPIENKEPTDAEGNEVSEGEGREEEVILEDEALLLMDIRDLGTDLKMMDAYMAASERFLMEAHKEIEQLRAKIDVQSRRADIIERVRTKLRKMAPDDQSTSIQTYLKRQNEARAKKAERAKAFIAAGTTAKDVIEQLQVKAPIDAAMNQRKPKPGSTRPALNLPVRR